MRDLRSRTPSPPETNTHRAPRRPRPSPLPALGILALLVTSAAAVLAAPGWVTPATSGDRTNSAAHASAMGAATGPSGSWAWGAAANISLRVQEAGVYNASQSLTGGNLTSTGAYIVLDEALAYRYATYEIVNATTPSNGTRAVTIEAVELQGVAFRIAASGTFPAAGTYGPSSPVSLVPMNLSLAAEVVVLNAYRAHLNLTTGPNGSLSLTDEHLESLRAVNLSLSAVNFPNVTRDAQGDQVLRYDTGSIAATGWAAENVSASFSPALTIVQGPLAVGNSWSASTMATFQGTAAYAVHYVASVPGKGSASWSQAATASANATVPVALQFTVVGTRTIVFPGGGSETDYAIAYSNGTGNTGVLVANGLAVLPARDPNHGAAIAATVPEHPAARAAAAPSASTTALYSPSRGLPDSVEAHTASGTTVTAAPMSVGSASGAIDSLRSATTESPRAPGAPPAVLVAAAIGIVGVLVIGRRLRQEVRTHRRAG